MKNYMLAMVVLTVSLGGCANLTPGEQRAATGTGIGAAGGALLGALGGNAALGAGVGAAAGLGGGLLVNSWKNNEHESYRNGYEAGERQRY